MAMTKRRVLITGKIPSRNAQLRQKAELEIIRAALRAPTTQENMQ